MSPTCVVKFRDLAAFAVPLAVAFAATAFSALASKEVGLAASSLAALGRVLASSFRRAGCGIMALTAAVAAGRA